MTDEELIKKWKSSKDLVSYKELKRRHTGMIHSFVHRYSAAAIPRVALETECYKLFDEAVDSYRDNAGAKFITHLNYQLRKIDRFVKKFQNVGRLPENISSRIGEYDRIKSKLSEELRRQPSSQEMSKAMKWSLSNVKRLEKSRRQDLFEGGFEGTGMDVSRQAAETKYILDEIREELDANEVKVFDLIMSGKGDKKRMAAQLGISSGRLSQITGQMAKKIAPHLSKVHGVGLHFDTDGGDDDA